MKKGELMSQPFMYIFIIVVLAFVLFFGVKMIINLINFSDKAQVANFVNDFKGRISDVYSDNYGSTVSLDNIKVPKNIFEVCVLNSNFPIDFSLINNDEFRAKLNLSVDGNNDNLFLYGDFDESSLESYKIDNLEIDLINPVCSVIEDNNIDFVFENKGNRVVVRTS